MIFKIAKTKSKKSKEEVKPTLPSKPTKKKEPPSLKKKKSFKVNSANTSEDKKSTKLNSANASVEKKATKLNTADPGDDKKSPTKGAGKKVMRSDTKKKKAVKRGKKDPEEEIKVLVKKKRRKIDKGILARRKLERMKKQGFLTPPPRRSAALNASAIMNCMLENIHKIKTEPPEMEEDIDLLTHNFDLPAAASSKPAASSISRTPSTASQKKSAKNNVAPKNGPVKRVKVQRARHARTRIRNLESADRDQEEGEGEAESDDVIVKPDSDLDKSPPKLRKVVKRRKKLKRRGDKKQADMKDFIVGRRMASMNASAMMSATYSQKWTRKDPLKMAIEASLRDLETIKDEPQSPGLPEDELSDSNENQPIVKSRKSSKQKLQKFAKQIVKKSAKLVKNKAVKPVKKAVKRGDVKKPVKYDDSMPNIVDAKNDNFASTADTEENDTKLSDDEAIETEPPKLESMVTSQSQQTDPSSSKSAKGGPAAPPPTIPVLGPSLAEYFGRSSTPLPPLIFTKAIPYEHDQELDQIVAGCFKKFGRKSTDKKEKSFNSDDPMFLKPSIAESDGLTSLDKKSATTPNSGRRPSLENKSGAAKSDDEESQRQKLIDSVLMRNRFRKSSGGKKSSVTGLSAASHSKSSSKDGKEQTVGGVQSEDMGGVGSKKRKSSEAKTESPTKTLIAPWKSGHQKLNLDVLSSTVAAQGHRNDLTSKIRGHRNDLTSKMGGKDVHCGEKKSVEKQPKKGGHTSLVGQPAPTQHVLPTTQVASGQAIQGTVTPSPGVGQPPTATVPPTLLPANQLPAQVKAPALVGTISPVKQSVDSASSRAATSQQFQQNYSSGSMTIPSTVYSTGYVQTAVTSSTYTGPVQTAGTSSVYTGPVQTAVPSSVYTGPYVHAVQPQQSQFYQGSQGYSNASTSSSGQQYSSTTTSSVGQYTGAQYGSYYSPNRVFTTGGGKINDGNQQPGNSQLGGNQAAAGGHQPAPGYPPGYYIATPTGNMTFPPGAVVAVTSGSQFAAYPVGSAAAATYQQAGAPGGAIIGPIIALGGGLQVPGGLPLNSGHQLSAASPATASSSQQTADAAKQRKQYGSSGKPVLRPSIDGSNKPHGKAAPIMAKPNLTSSYGKPHPPGSPSYRVVATQPNSSAYSCVASTRATDSVDYRGAAANIYQVSSIQGKNVYTTSVNTTSVTHNSSQTYKQQQQQSTTNTTADRSRQMLTETDNNKSNPNKAYRQIRPKLSTTPGGGKEEDDTNTLPVPGGGGGTAATPGNLASTGRPLQIVGPISGISSSLIGQPSQQLPVQQPLAAGSLPGGLVAAVLPQPHIPAVTPQILQPSPILQQPLYHHQPLNIPTITPSARLAAAAGNSVQIRPKNTSNISGLVGPKPTSQTQTIGHVSIHPKPNNIHLLGDGSSTLKKGSIGDSGGGGKVTLPGVGGNTHYSTTITPVTKTIHPQSDKSPPMLFQQPNSKPHSPPVVDLVPPMSPNLLPAALQADRCRLLAKNNVTIIPKVSSSHWRQHREIFPSGRPWGSLGGEPTRRKPVPEVVTLDDSPPREEPSPDIPEELDPATGLMEPASSGHLDPTSGHLEPAAVNQDLGNRRLDPASGHLEPASSGQLDPASGLLEPVCSLPVSTHAYSVSASSQMAATFTIPSSSQLAANVSCPPGGHPGLPNGLSRVASSAIQTTKSPTKVTTSRDYKTLMSHKRSLSSTPERDWKHAKLFNQIPPTLSPQVPQKSRGAQHPRISSSMARSAANALVRSKDLGGSPQKAVLDPDCDENISRSRLQLKPATSPKLMIDNYPVVQISKLKEEKKILKSFSSPILPIIPSEKVKQEKQQEKKKREVKRHSSGQPTIPAPLVPWSKRSKEPPKNCGGWAWVGEGVVAKVYLHNVDHPVERICYDVMRHEEGDEEVQVRDCILLASGSRKKDLPYIAKVTALWENPEDGEMMMSLLWYYRPEHVEGGRNSEDLPEELFASKHRDHTSVACIEDKCYVLTFNEFCRYKKFCRSLEGGASSLASNIVPSLEGGYARTRLLPACQVPQDRVFLCRKVYDSRCKRMLKNPI